MAPARLAYLDRLRASEAATDIVERLYAIRLDDGWPGDDALWEWMCRIWECAVTGHDPDDPAPLTADELVLVRLALL